MTLMQAIIYKASPIVCTNPDGSTFTRDNPLGELPFVGGIGQPDNCKPGPTMAEQLSDAVFGPGSFRDAVANFNKTVATFWVNVPPPEVANESKATGTVEFLQSSLMWYTMALMIAAVAIRGARIAWDSRNSAGHLEKLTIDSIRWIWVLVGATVAAGFVLIAGHEYSKWIIDKAAGDSDFATNLNALMVDPSTEAGLGLVAQYGLLAIAALGGVIQLFLMFVRSGVLVIMLGGWPLSASAGALASQDRTYDKYTGTIIALLLYEPAAATIYAGGISLIGTPSGGDATTNAIISICTGIALFIASIFTFFWLIKITQPSTDSLSESGGSRNVGMAAGGAAAMRR